MLFSIIFLPSLFFPSSFSICSCVGVASEGSPNCTLCKQNVTKVLDTLFVSLTDYTTDSRGDIGAMQVEWERREGKGNCLLLLLVLHTQSKRGRNDWCLPTLPDVSREGTLSPLARCVRPVRCNVISIFVPDGSIHDPWASTYGVIASKEILVVGCFFFVEACHLWMWYLPLWTAFVIMHVCGHIHVYTHALHIHVREKENTMRNFVNDL